MQTLSKRWLTVCAAVVMFMAGCCGTPRQAAELRWQAKLAAARLTAAQEAFNEGRYDLAKRQLEICLQQDPDNSHAQRLMAQVKAADALYAHLNTARINALQSN